MCFFSRIFKISIIVYLIYLLKFNFESSWIYYLIPTGTASPYLVRLGAWSCVVWQRILLAGKPRIAESVIQSRTYTRKYRPLFVALLLKKFKYIYYVLIRLISSPAYLIVLSSPIYWLDLLVLVLTIHWLIMCVFI